MNFHISLGTHKSMMLKNFDIKLFMVNNLEEILAFSKLKIIEIKKIQALGASAKEGGSLMTLKRNNKGFTIVELLIVIVVIGILAALVITTFSGIQQRARDTERETDVKAVHGHLETFYADNGFYPALADVNDVNFRTDAGGTPGQMVGLDAQALVPPNSTQTGLAAAAGGTGTTEVYGYTADNATAACATAGAQCDNYTLTANLEGGGTYTKSALN